MNQILLGRAAQLFRSGVSAPEAFRIATAETEARWIEMVLDLKWEASFDARAEADPMAPDYEALEEPTSQYADSRESAEAPAVQ